MPEDTQFSSKCKSEYIQQQQKREKKQKKTTTNVSPQIYFTPSFCPGVNDKCIPSPSEDQVYFALVVQM